MAQKNVWPFDETPDYRQISDRFGQRREDRNAVFPRLEGHELHRKGLSFETHNLLLSSNWIVI